MKPPPALKLSKSEEKRKKDLLSHSQCDWHSQARFRVVSKTPLFFTNVYAVLFEPFFLPFERQNKQVLPVSLVDAMIFP